MTEYHERPKKRPVQYDKPEQPPLVRAGIADGDPRQEASRLWLDNYLKQREALRGKKERIPLDPRLANAPKQGPGEGG